MPSTLTKEGGEPARVPSARGAVPRRAWQRWVVGVYVVLLVASWVTQWVMAGLATGERGAAAERPLAAGKLAVVVPRMTGGGEVAGGKPVRVAYLAWCPPTGAAPGQGVAEDRPAVVLLHGSPGTAENLRYVGPMLAAGGYRVYALDLPGFGDSTLDVPDYSVAAHARYVRAWMDAVGLQRVHVVGWSMSGGVVLHMAEQERARADGGRLASITMMGAIGDQRFEGSGSYWFEQGKYRVGYGVLVLGPSVLPHFGVLGDRAGVRSFLRNFMDTDMRPLAGMMVQTREPVMILHGRRDFLVRDRAAEHHHELIAGSRLVMLDSTHFLPFPRIGDPEGCVRELRAFFGLHEAGGGAPAERVTIDLSPRRPWFVGQWVGDLVVGVLDVWTPWWVVAGLIAVSAARWPRVTAVLVGLLVTELLVDLFVALVGLIGAAVLRRLIRSRTADAEEAGLPWEARPPTGPVAWTLGWVGLAVKAVLVGLAASVIAPTILAPLGQAYRAPGVIVGVLPAVLVLTVVTGVATSRGRWRLGTAWRRWRHHEFWPSWVFYMPLVPWLVWQALRARSVTAPLAANPGIEKGGGFVNESKDAINRGLTVAAERAGVPWAMLHARTVGAGEDAGARTLAVRAMLESEPELGGYPVILKPDAGQRGFGLKLARSEGDVREYFGAMTAAATLQRYHAGPCECGIMWIRRAGDVRADDGREGDIYAVTRKVFPVLVGDGEQTVEELILRHERFRCQAGVFFKRLGRAGRGRVLSAGERLRLGEAGNHAQGCLFTDGMDLVTPELEAVIDRIAREFPGPDGRAGGLDFGRFDVRYESDELLRRGRGFGIVELNGTSAEATSLYDPGKGLLWAYSVLFGQWRRLYELGAARERSGFPPMSLRALRAEARAHYRDRRGSAVSD